MHIIRCAYNTLTFKARATRLLLFQRFEAKVSKGSIMCCLSVVNLYCAGGMVAGFCFCLLPLPAEYFQLLLVTHARYPINTSPPPHTQTRQKAQECFSSMAQTEGFRNIAARTYTGHDAYANVTVCDRHSRRHMRNAGIRTGSDTGTKGGQGQAGRQECTESLSSALIGICRFNHIALRSETD